MGKHELGIVIPVHNDGDRVAATVRALDELGDNLQVAIVDDGSTDEATKQIVRAVVDTHPGWRSIRTPNRGPSSARNTGAAMLDTEAVAFLDAADEPLDGWVTSMERCLNDGVGIAHCTPLFPTPQGHQPLPDRSFLPGCFAIRRCLLEMIDGYDEQLWFAENSDFVERAHRACDETGLRIEAPDGPWLYVAKAPASQALNHYDEKRLRAMEHILVRDAERLRSEPDERERNAAIGAVLGVRLGEWRRALRLALLAIRIRPQRLDNWVRLVFVAIPPLGQRRWPADR